MIPQLGFGETLVIVLLAIIVVGPKDLPMLMRKVGGFIRKMKMMGQEFRQAFDEMGAEDEIAELRKEIEDLKKNNPVKEAVDDLAEYEKQMNDSVMRSTSDAAGSDPKDDA